MEIGGFTPLKVKKVGLILPNGYSNGKPRVVPVRGKSMEGIPVGRYHCIGGSGDESSTPPED